MRIAVTLAVLNTAIWGAFIAILPGTHVAWPGSYKFWWFDDVPWAFLAISIAALFLATVSPLRRAKVLGGVLITMLTIALAAALPYAAFSGGGV
jgi:hypothetical protein